MAPGANREFRVAEYRYAREQTPADEVTYLYAES